MLRFGISLARSLGRTQGVRKCSTSRITTKNYRAPQLTIIPKRNYIPSMTMRLYKIDPKKLQQAVESYQNKFDDRYLYEMETIKDLDETKSSIKPEMETIKELDKTKSSIKPEIKESKYYHSNGKLSNRFVPCKYSYVFDEYGNLIPYQSFHRDSKGRNIIFDDLDSNMLCDDRFAYEIIDTKTVGKCRIRFIIPAYTSIVPFIIGTNVSRVQRVIVDQIECIEYKQLRIDEAWSNHDGGESANKESFHFKVGDMIEAKSFDTSYEDYYESNKFGLHGIYVYKYSDPF